VVKVPFWDEKDVFFQPDARTQAAKRTYLAGVAHGNCRPWQRSPMATVAHVRVFVWCC
jgi:hypothetical protein